MCDSGLAPRLENISCFTIKVTGVTGEIWIRPAIR